jgi:hypothetical protein
VNDPPTAPDVTLATDEDTPLELMLPAADVDGDTLTFTHVQPSHGTFDGTTYRPSPNYNGPDAIVYTARDPAGATATGTIAITVRPVNDAPEIADVALATDEDTPAALVLSGTDVDGDVVSIAYDPPAHGTYDGSTYAPAANYHGADSFAYRASDGNGGSASATVRIEVRPVNDPPVAADVHVVTDEDVPVAVALTGTDVDGDALTVTHGAPAHGSFDGATYAPAPNFAGDDAFTYTVDDGHGGTATATVSITVRPANDPPRVVDRDVEALEDTPLPLTLTGDDPDGDQLTFTWSEPDHGSYDGQVYLADAGYTGGDTFAFTAEDGHGGTASGVVRITVRPVARLTVTLTGPPATDEGAAPVPFAAVASGAPAGATVTYEWSAGSGVLVPDGATASYGNDDGPRTDTVTVTATSGAASASASAEIRVRNVAPTAVAGADASITWGLPLLLQGTATDPSAADTAAGLAPQWTFAEGSAPVAGAAATRTYAGPGTDVATFSVTDKDGASAMDSLSVVVARRASSLELVRSGSAFGSATVTARLSDMTQPASGRLAGRVIAFTVGGETFTATTDDAGEATGRPSFPIPPGTHDVVARFDTDSHYLGSEALGRITVGAGAGRITGGGLRETGGDGRGGFNAMGTGDSARGELQWQSGATTFHAHDVTAVGVAPDRRSAWFAGVGRDGRRFVVYVEDNGEPGRNDVFRLWLDGALVTRGDGKLSGGNIQIRPPQPGPAGSAFAV